MDENTTVINKKIDDDAKVIYKGILMTYKDFLDYKANE